MFLLSKTVWCCNNYFQNVIFQMVGYSLFKRRWFLCLLCIYQCLLYLLKMITFPNYILIPVFWRAIVFFWRQKKKNQIFSNFMDCCWKYWPRFIFTIVVWSPYEGLFGDEGNDTCCKCSHFHITTFICVWFVVTLATVIFHQIPWYLISCTVYLQ